MMRFVIITTLAFCLAGSPSQAQSARSDLSTHAILQAKDEVVLSSKMSGRLTDLPFEEGQSFVKGDTLAGFACDILEAEQSVAAASVEGAAAELKNAKRLDKLKAAGALDLALAQAALAKARAQLDVAKSRARLCYIIAPYDGVVLSQDVRQFESVDTKTPIVRIGRAGALRVKIIAPAAWLSWITVQAPFTFVPSGSGKRYSGSIDRVGAAVDAASQTVKIEGILTGETPELLPGQSGVAYFASSTGGGQ
ncbi:efflux RND transporter periplasmic adaptor subunit [Magnetovibrio sp.]|uniref:efflux RND transporter periplasmic adaptor subunit n=1 Tax=Magnetovibrio sp. TaxID=2024836 RepID=UPI002F9598FC